MPFRLLTTLCIWLMTTFLTKPQTHHAHFDQSGTIWSGPQTSYSMVHFWLSESCCKFIQHCRWEVFIDQSDSNCRGKKLNLPSSADFILFVQKVTPRVKLWAQLQMDAILYPYSGAETVQQPLRRIWFPLSKDKRKDQKYFFFKKEKIKKGGGGP